MAQAQVNAPDLPKVVKAEHTELHYKHGHGHVSVHAAGCGHGKFAAEVRPFDVATSVNYADDWYYVAPCAKKK